MAGRSAHVRLISATPTVSENNNESRSSTLVPDPASARGRNNTMRTPERRRSSSQGDATPRAPAHTLSHSPAPGESPQTQGEHPTKRLGFFGDILLSSAGSISISSSAQRSSPIPHSFLPARTHSRGESALARDNASSPTPNMAASAGQPAKGHTSPSKRFIDITHPRSTLTMLPSSVLLSAHTLDPAHLLSVSIGFLYCFMIGGSGSWTHR